MFKDHNPYIRLRSDEDFDFDFELTVELHDLGEHKPKPIFTGYSTTMLKELR